MNVYLGGIYYYLDYSVAVAVALTVTVAAVAVVVFTSTRIIKSVVTRQAPATLEWKNTQGAKTQKNGTKRGIIHKALRPAGGIHPIR